MVCKRMEGMVSSKRVILTIHIHMLSFTLKGDDAHFCKIIKLQKGGFK